MKTLTTPNSCFDNIPDYPFAPHYSEVADGLNMHYVDEGEGPVVLLMHGEPSWSFLYRKMIPVLVAAGFRVIAPDLIGFGKSDKPTEQSDYSYRSHIAWVTRLLKNLELSGINLFCQDWGGLIGLRVVAENELLFDRVVTSNTILPMSGVKATKAFLDWREFSQKVPVFEAKTILQKATMTTLSEEELLAYDAPYPDQSYVAGARKFPMLVPFDGADEASVLPECDKAWEVFSNWEKPFLTLFGDSDPIMLGVEKVFQARIPGAKGQPHQIIKNGGHFIQEDAGKELAMLMADFIKTT